MEGTYIAIVINTGKFNIMSEQVWIHTILKFRTLIRCTTKKERVGFSITIVFILGHTYVVTRGAPRIRKGSSF